MGIMSDHKIDIPSRRFNYCFEAHALVGSLSGGPKKKAVAAMRRPSLVMPARAVGERLATTKPPMEVGVFSTELAPSCFAELVRRGPCSELPIRLAAWCWLRASVRLTVAVGLTEGRKGTFAASIFCAGLGLEQKASLKNVAATGRLWR